MKGLQRIEHDSKSLDAAEAADQLGIGRNMVKSIRHRLLGTGLTPREKRHQRGQGKSDISVPVVPPAAFSNSSSLRF